MTECGYWKPMGKEKHVVSFESNRAIGVKKSFVFYQGKQQQRRHPRGRGGFRTQWVMREYRLLGSLQTNSMDQDWVVCKIYQKKKRSSNKKDATVVAGTDLISYTKNIWNAREITSPPTVLVESNDDDKGPPQPSSSCSSGVSFCREAAAGDQEEITSAYVSSNNFFGYKNY